jgi:hypothetical protein
MRVAPGFSFLLGVLLCIGLCAPASAAGIQTIRNDITPLVTHLKPVGRLEAGRRLRLAISLPLRNQPALTELLAQLQNPASPNYHRYLTPAQFAERFGPAQGDYDAVIAFAQAHGLAVKKKHASRAILDVEGRVSDIEKALHVTMRTYRHPREARQFFAADADLSVELTTPVLRVSGLDDYAIPHPNLHPEPAGLGANAKANAGTGFSNSYAGSDFRNAYIPDTTLSGSGQSVALVEFDGYYDLDIWYYQFFAQTGYVPLVNVPVDGGIAAPGENNDEVSLDIEMTMSMAPGLDAIYVYEAPNGSPWVDILDQIACDNVAAQISCSWSGGDTDPASEEIFQRMAAQGQTFFQASGDSDAYTGAIPFPCDSPNISVVGATTLTTDDSVSYVSETVWNWGNGIGSSGGVSPTYGIPTWQRPVNMSGNQGSTTMRNIPDMAMAGDNIEVIFDDGYWGIFGGTSCAAPLWAAFNALVNENAAGNGQAPVGFVNPAIYAIGTGTGYAPDFNDVTSGNDFSASSPSMFSAVAGYDLCTGWGSPTGALINALAPARPADALQVPYARYIITGTSGGPFAPAANSYVLTNTSAQSIQWTASATQNWLTLSATSGVIAASGSASFTASVNAAANGLGVGIYSDGISIADVTSGVQQSLPVSLVVIESAPILIVSPVASFTPTGFPGGPFTPSSATYSVINVGNAPMTWSVGNGSEWLTASPSGGTLAAGGTATVTASVTAGANGLPPGSYDDGLIFTNVTNDAGDIGLEETLTVILPPPVITSGTVATGTNGYSFTYQIAASNSPASYSATGLPAGLSVDGTTGLISGTATAIGASAATISAINTTGTGSATLLITIDASYAGWQEEWFNPGQLGNPSISGDTATPAGDGIPNLLKYALNLNPLGNGQSGLPAPSTMVIGGTTYLTLTYNQVIQATDLTYTPEVSGDLQDWNSGLGYVAPVSVTPNGDGVTERVVVQDLTPVSAGAPRFIRLQVTGP